MPGAERATPGMGLAAAIALFSLLLAAGAVALVSLLDPAMAAHDGSTIALLALNVLPTLLFGWLLLALTRRPALSLGLALLLLYILYAVSELKSRLLDTPLLPSDFVLLGHLGDGGGLLLRYVSRSAIAALVAAFAFAAVLAWIEQPWRRLRGWRHWTWIAVAAGLSASLVAGVRPWSTVYSDEAAFLRWSPAESALNSGLPSTLVRYSWHVDFLLPEPDRDAARRFLQAHPAGPVAEGGGKPDIVVLQSESFFDAARLRGLEPAQVLPELRRVSTLSRHGELRVPAYGGGTIRTEFEVLTGIAMRYFPEVEYPYFRLTAAPLPSIAHVLAANGYRVIAVHPHEREFWNRASAFRNLGIGEFDDDRAFVDAPRAGWFVSDEALVDHVLARLDGSAQPTFVFAISMENHGPYEDYPNVAADALAREPVPAGLAGGAARELRGYLHHLANADRSLGRLVDALAQRPRRTLLLFYGDHLPALPDVYEQVGFDDGKPAPLQPVPWLLFDSAHPQATTPESSAAFYLPALLLAEAGIGDGYFRALEAARQDDAPTDGWQPVDEDALRALMLMRQRGEAP